MNEQVSLEDLYKIIYDKNDLSNAVIEINDECNFQCDHCYLGNKTKSFMSLELFKKIIDELYSLECLSILITGGEPFMNPAFIDMYIYAKEKGFLVSVNTNGSLISDKIIELFNKYCPYVVEISLYGYNKETYLDFTHTQSYNLVLDNINKLKDNSIPVKLKTVLTDKNYYYLDKLISLAEKLDIPFRYDYIIFPNIFSSKLKNELRLDSNEIINIIKKNPLSKKHFNDKILNLKVENDNHIFQCMGGEQSIYIDSNGYINMCVALVNKKYNINDVTIAEAIRKIRKFKSKLRFDNNSKCKLCNKKSICRYCPARFKLETGSYSKCPDWYCDVANLILDEYDTFLCDSLDEKMLAKMFKIVSVNMSKLYNSKITDADFEIWSNNVSNNLQLKTIINYDGDLNGYIQYMEFANEKKICICEFEIISTKQGNGITFNKLLKEFLNEHKSEKYNNYIVYGNISNSNIHSQDVFKHLGFKNIEKNIYQIDLSLLQQTKIN